MEKLLVVLILLLLCLIILGNKKSVLESFKGNTGTYQYMIVSYKNGGRLDILNDVYNSVEQKVKKTIYYMNKILDIDKNPVGTDGKRKVIGEVNTYDDIISAISRTPKTFTQHLDIRLHQR